MMPFMFNNMKSILIRKPTDNKLDNLVEGLVDNMDFSDSTVLYTNKDGIKPNDGVPAEWFIPAWSGLGSDSERSAINQYVTMNSKYDDLGDIFLGIGITEMKHLDEIGDTITKLGGTLENVWNSQQVKYGTDIITAVEEAILGEQSAIAFYEDLLKKLSMVGTETSLICIQLVNKLLADERWHLNLLNKIYKIYK